MKVRSLALWLALLGTGACARQSLPSAAAPGLKPDTTPALDAAPLAAEAAHDRPATTPYRTLERQLHLIAEEQLDVGRDEVDDLFAELQAQRTLAQAALRSASERADHALEPLRGVATVREEARGTVIALSSQGLFPDGKAELLPAARAQLREIAHALAALAPDGPILIEAHALSGDGAADRGLSQERALAVRRYLVENGVLAQRITALSKKPSRSSKPAALPEADVEIVLGGTHAEGRSVAKP